MSLNSLMLDHSTFIVSLYVIWLYHNTHHINFELADLSKQNTNIPLGSSRMLRRQARAVRNRVHSTTPQSPRCKGPGYNSCQERSTFHYVTNRETGDTKCKLEPRMTRVFEIYSLKRFFTSLCVRSQQNLCFAMRLDSDMDHQRKECLKCFTLTSVLR